MPLCGCLYKAEMQLDVERWFLSALVPPLTQASRSQTAPRPLMREQGGRMPCNVWPSKTVTSPYLLIDSLERNITSQADRQES